jgi:hypothetical protein
MSALPSEALFTLGIPIIEGLNLEFNFYSMRSSYCLFNMREPAVRSRLKKRRLELFRPISYAALTNCMAIPSKP